MTRPPPTSTLFPYTTLFRSRRLRCRQAQLDRKDRVEYRSVLCVAHSEREDDRRPENRVCQDRKSTRLNSSHTVISYAVFCLKKKRCDNQLPVRGEFNGVRRG